MQLQTIHCFLAHPGKHMPEQPTIGGTSVPKQGKLYSMLKNIYDTAESDCRTEISFNPTSDGKQQNDCRDLGIPGFPCENSLSEMEAGHIGQKVELAAEEEDWCAVV